MDKPTEIELTKRETKLFGQILQRGPLPTDIIWREFWPDHKTPQVTQRWLAKLKRHGYLLRYQQPYGRTKDGKPKKRPNRWEITEKAVEVLKGILREQGIKGSFPPRWKPRTLVDGRVVPRGD